MNLDTEKLTSLARKIIGGITSDTNPAVFTGRGSRHYMEAWDWFQGRGAVRTVRILPRDRR